MSAVISTDGRENPSGKGIEENNEWRKTAESMYLCPSRAPHPSRDKKVWKAEGKTIARLNAATRQRASIWRSSGV